jgi:hypothetical protein
MAASTLAAAGEGLGWALLGAIVGTGMEQFERRYANFFSGVPGYSDNRATNLLSALLALTHNIAECEDTGIMCLLPLAL